MAMAVWRQLHDNGCMSKAAWSCDAAPTCSASISTPQQLDICRARPPTQKKTPRPPSSGSPDGGGLGSVSRPWLAAAALGPAADHERLLRRRSAIARRSPCAAAAQQRIVARKLGERSSGGTTAANEPAVVAVVVASRRQRMPLRANKLTIRLGRDWVGSVTTAAVRERKTAAHASARPKRNGTRPPCCNSTASARNVASVVKAFWKHGSTSWYHGVGGRHTSQARGAQVRGGPRPAAIVGEGRGRPRLQRACCAAPRPTQMARGARWARGVPRRLGRRGGRVAAALRIGAGSR